jgi:hypothetical protein
MAISMKDIPGPKPYNNLYQVYKLFSKFNNGSLALLEEFHAQYGDMVRVDVMGQPQLFVANPEHFREIMVTKAKVLKRTRIIKTKIVVLPVSWAMAFSSPMANSGKSSASS